MNDIGMTSLLTTQLETAQYAAQNRKTENIKHVSAEKSHIRKTAEDFEAMFLSQMLSYMYTDIDPNNPMGGGGKGEEVFRSLMINEYGKLMVKAGGLGIADSVESEMIRMQEMAQKLR